MLPQKRREQILTVAAQIFSEKGYRLTNVTDIVEGAGIGRGTFYLYFDSKKDIFLELVEKYFSDFAKLLKENHKRLEEAVRKNGEVVEIWGDNMKRIMKYHHDNPNLTSVVYRDALGRDEDFSERVDRLSRTARKQILKELKTLQQHGLVRNCDLTVVTNIVLGSFIYVIMQNVVRGKRRSLEDLTREIMEYHVRALMPRTGNDWK